VKPICFVALAAEAGTRLDQLAQAHAPELSRARAQALIEDGHVQVDGKPAKASLRVRAGASIEIRVPAPIVVELRAQDMQLRALYEDKHLVVIDKPAGIAVHPGAGGEGSTLVHGLLHHIADLRGIGGELRPGIVHRLDKDTSGCLVVAKSEAALRGLQASFKAREVEKRYLAITHGVVTPQGELDTLYGRHPIDRKRFSSKVKSGKRAQTRWTQLGQASAAGVGGAGASVLAVELLTGRTHQIRAHFSDAGHPLLGDVLYGGAKREAKLEPDSRLRQAAAAVGRQALHAWVLEFQHPITAALISCTAPVPIELLTALGLLEIDPGRLDARRRAPASRSR